MLLFSTTVVYILQRYINKWIYNEEKVPLELEIQLIKKKYAAGYNKNQ